MRIIDFVKLTRLEHALMLAIAVLVGEIISAGHLPGAGIALLSFLPAILLEMASFSINDYFDLDSDRLNRRFDRPLVAGTVSPGFAYSFSLASFFFGVIISSAINLNAFLISLVFALLSYLYSYRLKDIALVGNLYVASTMAIPFIYGYFVVSGNPSSVLVVSLIAFVTGIAREITLTIRDIHGDKRGRGSETLPVIIGVRNSAIAASILYIVAVLLSFLPYLYIENYKSNLYYLAPVLVTDVILIYIALNIVKNQRVEFLNKCRNMSLIAMFIGLLGFLLGVLA